KLIKSIRTCLKNNNQPPEEKSIAILLAEENILTVMKTLEEKQIDTESMQQLLLQLFKDLQTLGNTSIQLKQEAQDSSQYWKPHVYYSDDDDDFFRESIDETPPSDAIAPDLPITDSLIDFLLEEFAGELALINPIPPGIVETNFDPKENIRLIKKLLYDNSSPRPSKGLNSKNDFKKKNSGSTTIHTYISLIEYESFYDESDSASEIFNDDLAHIISPSEYEYVYADDESDSGDLTTKVVDDISDNSTRELYVHVPNVLTTLPTLYPVFDTLLPFSFKNKDKIFNPGILISKEEKSPPLLSHRGLKVFQLINDSESPMMIYGGDIPILDVPYLHFYPP
nr:hypothetical protein [Tanacetum cinerariifolium]